MLSALLIAFLAVLGYLLDYFLEKQKNRSLRKWIAILGIILSLIVIGTNYYHQKKQIGAWEDKFASAQTTLNEIIEQNKHLLGQNDSLRVQVKDINEKLQPFLLIARNKYPTLNEQEGLVKLISDISQVSRTLEGMQPKLIWLAQETRSGTDKSGLVHTIYFFDSQYPIPLKNISIEMTFENTIIDAKSIFLGGMVIDNGSRTTIANDRRGFTFVTDLLIVGNKIMIDVTSKDQLSCTSMRLFP
jgi:hypothetical protein